MCERWVERERERLQMRKRVCENGNRSWSECLDECGMIKQNSSRMSESCHFGECGKHFKIRAVMLHGGRHIHLLLRRSEFNPSLQKRKKYKKNVVAAFLKVF